MPLRIHLIFVFPLIVLLGCTSTPKENHPPVQIAEKKSAVQNVNTATIASDGISADQGKEERAIGTIFAKTVFSGLTKTGYIELRIIDEQDSSKSYQITIGDKSNQGPFPWPIKTVEPGYFYAELPAGYYRFSSVHIPVGTTKAEEVMDVSFQVRANADTYLGTMVMTGTKEKIKLGGIPLIQPGFEYTIEILDERDEALIQFLSAFPDRDHTIHYQLMTANQLKSQQDSP